MSKLRVQTSDYNDANMRQWKKFRIPIAIRFWNIPKSNSLFFVPRRTHFQSSWKYMLDVWVIPMTWPLSQKCHIIQRF